MEMERIEIFSKQYCKQVIMNWWTEIPNFKLILLAISTPILMKIEGAAVIALRIVRSLAIRMLTDHLGKLTT